MLLAILKSLADPTRLRLLNLLQQGDFTVQELTSVLDMGQSRISRHLKILSQAGLLQVNQQGTWHYYRLAPDSPFLDELWAHLQPQLDALPETERDRQALADLSNHRRRRSRDFFDRHAAGWEALAASTLRLPDYLDELTALVPSAPLIVEVGVGTGQLLPRLVELGGKVVGIDQAPAMVGRAREQAARYPDKAEIRLGEMTHLPLASSTAGAVVMNQVLHHAENPAGAIGEIARVLAPGGRFVLADLLRHGQERLREEMADIWLGFERQELRSWLGEAGLYIDETLVVTGDEGCFKVLIVAASRPPAINNPGAVPERTRRR